MGLRYLFDEHLRGALPEAVVRLAARHGFVIDVVQVGDAVDLPLGTSDLDILRWAEEHGRIVVSHDTKTLPEHLAEHLAAGRHSPSVFIARRPLNLALAEWLVLAAFASDAPEWKDRVTFVP
jgi:hypothetical protein